MGLLRESQQLHGRFIKLGSFQNLHFQSQTMNAYFNCDADSDARKLLEEMPDRNTIVWNSVICSIINKNNQVNKLLQGISHFRRMLLDFARPDAITFNALLRLCAGISRELHCFMTKTGFSSHSFVVTALVDSYSKCNLVADARRAFDEVSFRDCVLWNAMVYCYASRCSAEEAARVFNLMRSDGLAGDEFTLTSLLASSSVVGEQIHGIAIRRGFDVDVPVATALVDAYCKSGNLCDACKILDVTEIPSTVTWNALIAGYGQRGEVEEALKIFTEMIRREIFPEETTLSSIIGMCGDSSAENTLGQVHACVSKSGFGSFLSVSNALISSYAKCGCIGSAFQCFSSSMERDVFTWTSMITGYAFHGLTREATECFEEMLSCGEIPDKIAFLAALAACSHGGLVGKGLEYFKIMTRKYQITPDPEHYACLVDLVARFGLLEEAFAVLSSVPAGESAYGAFLGACRVHKNPKLAELARERLVAAEPDAAAANYAAISNMYSSEGRWGDVARVRVAMRRNCGRKSPGFSWLEISGDIHAFVSGDCAHRNCKDVYNLIVFV